MGNKKYDRREKTVLKRKDSSAPRGKNNTLKTQETIELTKIKQGECVQDYEDENFETSVAKLTFPKVLVTTSRRASSYSIRFAKDLESVFPNSEFNERGSLDDLESLVRQASSLAFTHIMIVEEHAKIPIGLTVVSLPSGPCFLFKLSSVKLAKDIKNHGKCSSHSPELILNNFHTGIGKLVGKFLTTLFPKPEFNGRQVVTFHNQRDFIFFRRHRYVFDGNEKRHVRTQEIGPQFTMKLKKISKSLFDENLCVFDSNFIKEQKKITSSESSRSINNKIFIN